MTVRDMTEIELAVLQDMMAGKIESLAAVLKDEDSDLHPMIRRFLAALISGSKKETDFRLSVVRHPDLRLPSQGHRARLQADTSEIEVAFKMAINCAKFGDWEAALTETMRQTKLGRSRVAALHKRHTGFIEWCVNHNHVSLNQTGIQSMA